MNKISVFTVITALTIPAFATEKTTEATTDTTLVTESAITAETTDKTTSATVTTEQAETSDSVAETEPLRIEQSSPVAYTEPTNPEIKFPHGMQIGVGVSATSGLNGFIGYANKKFDSFWWKRIGFRLDFASTKPLKSLINRGVDKVMGDDGIDIGDNLTINDGTIKAHHMAAMIDIYPFGDTWFLGGWRLTGGYYLGKMDITANLSGHIDGLPSDPIEFKLMDTQYRYNGGDINGTARANWKFNGPYVGTGFDLGLFWGIKMYLDAGVVFTNKAAELSLDVPVNDKLQVWDGTAWQGVQSTVLETAFENAKRDALADAQKELDDIKFYPMIKLGFMYRF